jgi:hypothetical protein
MEAWANNRIFFLSAEEATGAYRRACAAIELAEAAEVVIDNAWLAGNTGGHDIQRLIAALAEVHAAGGP